MILMRKPSPVYDDRLMQFELNLLHFIEARLVDGILPAPVTMDLSAYLVNGTIVRQKHTIPSYSQTLIDLQYSLKQAFIQYYVPNYQRKSNKRLEKRLISLYNGLIAIHDIDDNPDDIWESEKEGVNWLKDSDMLPRAAPQARLMRFAWESQWFRKIYIDQRFSVVAEQLLIDLSTMR